MQRTIATTMAAPQISVRGKSNAPSEQVIVEVDDPSTRGEVIAILAAAGFKLTSVSGASGNNHRFDRTPI